MVPPPVSPWPLASIRVDRPKSVTLTTPSLLTMTFSGLMSRCRMPALCATSSAWDTELNTLAIMSSVMSLSSSRMIFASVLPSTYSMIT